MYNPWFAGALILAVLGLISMPPFRVADAPPTDTPERRSVIDGLRGFAAFGVFFQHASITHDYVIRGVWQLPPSRFFSVVGQVGVEVFFLITGYLFWTKLLKERGRPNWVALYMGRVFRIGPVYSVAVAGLLIAVAVFGKGAIVEGWGQILGEVARWMCLGMFSAVPVNGDPGTNFYVAGVVWSLQFEWAFYAALPLLAVGAKSEIFAMMLAITLAFGSLAWWYHGGPYWLGGTDAIFALLFAAGMICATAERIGFLLQTPRWLLSSFCLMITIMIFVLFPNSYGLAPTLFLIAAFYMVLSGGDVFGLLQSRPARRLGDISFGIYMLQGLVLTAIFRPRFVQSFAFNDPFIYWSMVFVAAFILVFLATAAHQWIERPGIRGGREFIRIIHLLWRTKDRSEKISSVTN